MTGPPRLLRQKPAVALLHHERWDKAGQAETRYQPDQSVSTRARGGFVMGSVEKGGEQVLLLVLFILVKECQGCLVLLFEWRTILWYTLKFQNWVSCIDVVDCGCVLGDLRVIHFCR